jgi:hypothetical protein
MPQDPDFALVRGALDSRLESRGFKFINRGRAAGSGGEFAEAHYARGSRRLELWWRFDLLAVRYVDEDAVLDHSLYLSLLGARASKRFPCSGGLATQVEALASDLDAHCAGFLDPASDEVRRLAADHARDPGRFRGLRGL